MSNIYDKLIKDHKEVRTILNSILKDPNNPEHLKNLEEEFFVHSLAEEKTFYEPLKRKLPNLALALEGGFEEHDIVFRLLQQLHETSLTIEEKIQLLEFIKRDIEAHIEKEETDIFNLAKTNFSKEEAQAIGEKFDKEKELLKEQMPHEEYCDISNDEEELENAS